VFIAFPKDATGKVNLCSFNGTLGFALAKLTLASSIEE